MALPKVFTPCNMDRKNGPLKVWRNAPFPNANWRFRVNQVVTNLTGLVILMQVRLYEGADDPPLIDLSSEDSSGDYISIVDAASGLFLPIIRQTTLEALPQTPGVSTGRASGKSFETFSFDIRVGTTAANALVFAYGTFLLETGVTR